MRTSTFLIPIGLSSLAAAQTYVLEDDYEAANFFDMFDFFTVRDTGYCFVLSYSRFPQSADPTNGLRIICGPDDSAERWSYQHQ